MPKLSKTPEEIKKGLECCDKFLGGGHWNICSKCPYDMGKGRCYGTMMADALAYIQQLEAQVPRWIPVEERLPEGKPPYCQTVNVRTIDGKVLPGFCNHGLWYVMREEDDFCNDADEGEVTHWMPLPEAPKEDEK